MTTGTSHASFLLRNTGSAKYACIGSRAIWEYTGQITQDSCCLPTAVLVLSQEPFGLQTVSLFTELHGVIPDLMAVQTQSNLGKNAFNRLQGPEIC